MILYVLLHPLKLLPALLPVTPHTRCRVLRSAGIADISEAPGAIQAAVPAPVCGHEPNHSAFLVDVPSCRLPPLPPTRLQGGARWPLAASPKKHKWKKRRAAFISSLWSEMLSDFWQRGADWKHCSLSSWRAKDQVALRTLSPRGEKHVLCPSSPHMQGQPTSTETIPHSSSRFKADPSMEAAILQPDDDGRGAESSSRSTQVHKTGARDLPGAAKAGPVQHFSSLYCSSEGQERCARAPLGAASPRQAGFRQLALGASNPSGGVRPVLSHSQIRGVKRWQPSQLHIHPQSLQLRPHVKIRKVCAHREHMSCWSTFI